MIQPPNVNHVNGFSFCATRPKSKWYDSRLLGTSDCGCWSFVMLRFLWPEQQHWHALVSRRQNLGWETDKQIGQMRGGKHMTFYDYLSFTQPKIFLAGAFRYDTWGEMIQFENTFSTTKHLCLQFWCWKSIFLGETASWLTGKFPHVFIDVVEVFQRIDGRNKHFSWPKKSHGKPNGDGPRSLASPNSASLILKDLMYPSCHSLMMFSSYR